MEDEVRGVVGKFNLGIGENPGVANVNFRFALPIGVLTLVFGIELAAVLIGTEVPVILLIVTLAIAPPVSFC